MYKYELHAHTSECDRDAHLSARELVHLYKEEGYDGMVITDHYIERFYTLWFPEEVQSLSHEQQVYRWLKGYRTAKEEGEKIGFTVLPGAEVRFDDYPNDYLLYGLQEDFFYSVPRLNELKNVQELLSLMPEGVCVVQAHPFRNGMAVAYHFANYYNMAMTSGSDIHDMSRLANGGIMTKEQIRTPDDLSRILRSGRYTLIQN